MHLIFGSSSGIGLALAKELHAKQEPILLCTHRPSQVREQFPDRPPKVFPFDGLASDTGEALDEIFRTDHRFQTIYIVFGTGHLNPQLDPKLETETTLLNVQAFTAVASRAMQHLIQQGEGKLIGISSVAAVRGSHHAPAYNASKAFMASYLEGLRLKAANENLPIQVTEIRPGFVKTDMMKTDKPLWPISPEVAVKGILSAVERRKKVAYVSSRWRWVAFLLRLLPSNLYQKL